MAARIIAVYTNGALQGLSSATATIDFASVRIGASNLPIAEASGKFDFGGIILGNIAAASANGQAVEYAQFNSALALYIPLTQKGANNGVASLDSGGKVPASQLPNTVMEFQGQWNASTNSPTLADGTGNAGDVYRVNVAGSQNLGSGSISFAVGDWVMYSGTIWQLASNSNAVNSVNGFQGVVVLTTTNIAEGTNLYYTQARFDTAFSGKTTTNLAEGTNLYYTQARFDTAFAAKSTTNLSEGTNLYYTQARFDTAFAAKSTTNLAEGTNLYYTQARFDAAFLAKDSRTFVNDNAGSITIRQVVYVKANGHLDLARADIASINNFRLGLVNDASIATTASGVAVIGDGYIMGGFSGLTMGSPYYLSPSTAGAITTTAPSASGQSIYEIGRAISATELEFTARPIIELL